MATTRSPRSRRTSETIEEALESDDLVDDATSVLGAPSVITVDEEDVLGAGELPPSKYKRFDPRRVSEPAPLMPLAVLVGLSLVVEFEGSAFRILTPEIKDTYHLSLTGLSTITAVTLPIALLLDIPVGYFADRVRRMRMACFGLALFAVFSAMTGFAGVLASLSLLYAARIGAAVGSAFQSTQNSLLADFYPVQIRARIYYAHRIAASLGMFLGPVAIGVLTIFFHWQIPFFVLATPAVVVIYFGLRLGEPVRGEQERRHMGADDELATTEEEPAGFAETFRVLFNTGSARRIYYSLPFLTASSIGLQSFVSLFFQEVLHQNATHRSFLIAAAEPAQLVGLFGGLVIVQKVMAKNPGRALRLVGLIAVASAICLVGFALSPSIWVAFFFYALYGMFTANLLPGIFSTISLSVPARMRTLGFATGSLWLLLGVPILPFVGAIGDHYGLRVGILMFIPVYIIGSLLLGSAGKFLNEDIQREHNATMARAEVRKRRLDGNPQMMIIRGLNAGYDQTQILFDVDFEVADGEIIALLGTNGAGKSTLLKAISGIIQPMSGAIIFDGRDITNADAIQSAHMGIAQVPGGRGIFPSLTVAENLRAAGWMYRKDKKYLDEATNRVMDMFPILRKRADTPAGSLSGGEQQMMSLSQAFIAKPKLLMIDELSLGLAPTIVEQLLDIVRAIHDQGTTIILVEQSVNVALRIAKRAVFMEKGEIRFFGSTEDLLERPDILRSVFLQGAQEGMELGTGADGAAKDKPKKMSAAERKADEERRAALLQNPVVLEARDIVKRYGGVTAVNGASFQLHEGEILGLIGPNGAGKTTIFDMLSGFIPMNGGQVFYLGQDVTDWPPHKRAAAGLGRSFQDARLWPSLTVRETIAAALSQTVEVRSALAAAFGLPSVEESERAVDARVEELIQLMGLAAFRDKFISELSTGSRRMVEIATLIANEPKVLILDEPSSGIAQKETEALGPVLKEVQRFTDCAILVIEHDMPLLATLADHVVGLELGAVIAEGTPDEVLNHPRVIESYLGTASYDEIGIGGAKAAPKADDKSDGKPAPRRSRRRTTD